MPNNVRQRLFFLAGFATASLLTACGSAPIVNQTGVDPVVYQQDLSDCKRYADEVRVAQKTGTGAVAGAAAGALIGVIIGDTGRGAGVGAVQGGTSGTVSGVRERRTVVRNCLRDKGYSVYN